MRKLILIRHGETDYVAQGRYCGHDDIPLNANGIKQAKRLKERLKGLTINRVYSSDLKRALETVRMVFPNRAIFRRKALREIDLGGFSGLTYEEVNQRYPAVYKAWIDDPASVKIPGGESMADFTKRVVACFEEIFSQNSKKTVALVSHGGPIRIMLLKMQGKDAGQFWSIGQDTAAVNIVEFGKNGPEAIKINDTTYLE